MVKGEIPDLRDFFVYQFLHYNHSICDLSVRGQHTGQFYMPIALISKFSECGYCSDFNFDHSNL